MKKNIILSLSPYIISGIAIVFFIAFTNTTRTGFLGLVLGVFILALFFVYIIFLCWHSFYKNKKSKKKFLTLSKIIILIAIYIFLLGILSSFPFGAFEDLIKGPVYKEMPLEYFNYYESTGGRGGRTKKIKLYFKNENYKNKVLNLDIGLGKRDRLMLDNIIKNGVVINGKNYLQEEYKNIMTEYTNKNMPVFIYNKEGEKQIFNVLYYPNSKVLYSIKPVND